MQKNLSAVYSGEYTQWNTRLHSLQVMLFMYKQMQDQGVRLGDGGALCYSWGLVFSRMPNDEYDSFERSFGDSLVWRRNYASGKRLNTLTFYWLGELGSFSKWQDQAIKQMVSQHLLASDRPHELPAPSTCMNVGETTPFHETSVQTQ